MHCIGVSYSPECKRDISYLKSLRGASDKLHIFNADLDQPESFNAAIEGCTGVFHVAHPNPLKEQDEEIVTKKSVEGTLGILRACLKFKTVKRVVYTSSAATISHSGTNKDIVDESTWTDVEYHRSLKVRETPYVAAKTKTEQAALEFAEKNGLEIVTLIPPLVIGRFLCNTLPSSVYLFLCMIQGNEHLYGYLKNKSMVHIDDLVSAHIFLFENPDAKGSSLKGIEGHKMCGYSSQKLLNSGFKFKHGLEDMFDGAVQSCREKGFL
ncbi:hypothetical protein ACLB2K_076910 [Fragaria x ananassa]